MPTEKRQRKREGRQLRLEAERKAAQRARRRRQGTLIAGALGVLFVVFALISFLGDDDDGDTDVAAGDVPDSVCEPPPAAVPTNGPLQPTATRPAGAVKPEVTIPEGPPPTALQCTEINEGDGAVAVPGAKIEVDYVGVNFATKAEFDASWNGDRLFALTLGAGDVISGWDQGLLGMKEGGRRMLTIPPALGYGDRAQGADIPPNSTLVFVVDLRKVTPPEPATPEPTGPDSTTPE